MTKRITTETIHVNGLEHLTRHQIARAWAYAERSIETWPLKPDYYLGRVALYRADKVARFVENRLPIGRPKAGTKK